MNQKPQILISLGFKTNNDFEYNLNSYLEYISNAPDSSIILAPEVAISDFCYDRMDDASEYAKNIKAQILQHLHKQERLFDSHRKRKLQIF